MTLTDLSPTIERGARKTAERTIFRVSDRPCERHVNKPHNQRAKGEHPMLTTLSTLIAILNRTPGEATTVAWNPCNYDCYDDGGCSHCSEFHCWDDPEYGRIGTWFAKEGPYAYSGQRGLTKQQLAEEQERQYSQYIEHRHAQLFSLPLE
jgi:hypothetical protein